MATADLLSKIRGELDARLREVGPLLAEYEQLLVAAAALDSAGEDVPATIRASRPGQVKHSSVRSVPRKPARRKPARTASKPARASSKPVSPRHGVAPKRARPGVAPKRAQRGAAAVAIIAALEHGSHTVSELAIVTAMSSPIINSNLRRLQQAGTITRTMRKGDGKAAYALSSAPV
jgi:hypothetical protein